MITSERLVQAGLTTPETAARVAGALDAAASRFGIDTAERVSAWLAQCSVESCGFRVTVERLNYSAAMLVQVWPNRFNEAQAQAYAHQPERIASYVYGGRLGNGLEPTGDGWRYRGRGLIQLTGRHNYLCCGDALGVDLIESPDLVATPEYAALSAAWFWDANSLSRLADKGEIDAISKRVNGGTLGLEERRALYRKALVVFVPEVPPAEVPDPQIVTK